MQWIELKAAERVFDQKQLAAAVHQQHQ